MKTAARTATTGCPCDQLIAKPPARSSFLPRERALIGRLTSPDRVQTLLNALAYNDEPNGITLRSFREVLRTRVVHCFEAALAAAVILEQHGYPPLIMSLESVDDLDHTLFVYRHRGRWGAVGRSRDPGLHGRRPVFRTPRALALSYVDPYVDFTGRITGYAVVNMWELGTYDWRFSPRNVWKAERLLLEYPHRPIATSDRRIERLRRRYRAFKARYPDRRPVDYRGRERWSELPRQFRIGMRNEE